MTDHGINEDLQAWIDGELDPRRASEVSAAIERDETLARQAAELRALDGLLGSLPDARPAPDFGARVVRAAHSERSWIGRHWLGATAAACLLVVGILVLDPFTSSGKDPTEESWVDLVPPETVKGDDIEQIVTDIEWIDDEFLATGQ